MAARVLRENKPVRRALQQKFRYLLVDEFQDTDPVQAEIVFWLAEDSEASPRTKKKNGDADWREVPLQLRVWWRVYPDTHLRWGRSPTPGCQSDCELHSI
jgi:superfamily I DNA/RNA helicase